MTSRFALPIPSAIHTLMATNTIPQLSNTDRLEVTEYLFKRASFSERIAVAEVAYLNRKHPQARDLFLASTMPLANRRSAQIAYRLFVLPTQWQFECMYNGAFMALLRVFAHPRKLEASPDSFRRYLFNNLSWGAYQGYFGGRRTGASERLRTSPKSQLRRSGITIPSSRKLSPATCSKRLRSIRF